MRGQIRWLLVTTIAWLIVVACQPQVSDPPIPATAPAGPPTMATPTALAELPTFAAATPASAATVLTPREKTLTREGTVAPPRPIEPDREMSQRAIADLAQRLGLDPERITVQSTRPTQFPDASLGMRQPGRMYAQVVTPGYIIGLSIGDATYTYHSDGQRVVFVGADVLSSGKRDYRRSPALPESGTNTATVATVRVFYRQQLRGANECGRVFPVERLVPIDDVEASAALEALFRGPTAAERDLGFDSLFSDKSRDLLRSVRVADGTAYVNIGDVRDVASEADTDCRRLEFLASVEHTLREVNTLERIIFAFEGEPKPFYEWQGIGCGEANDDCDESPFRQTLGPMRRELPAAPPSRGVGVDLSTILPDGTSPLRQASADLDGDGMPEIVLVARLTPLDGSGDERLELLVIDPERSDRPIAWRREVVGERAEPLDLRDINGDGHPEVLSPQSVGASGQTLYVVAWQGTAFDLLRPIGGRFGGQESYGETGFGLVDEDGDGVLEILAAYGPAASKIDVYRWDGSLYVHETTKDYAGS